MKDPAKFLHFGHQFSFIPDDSSEVDRYAVYELSSGLPVCYREIHGGLSIAENDAFVIATALNWTYSQCNLLSLSSDQRRVNQLAGLLGEFPSGFASGSPAVEFETGKFEMRSSCGERVIYLSLPMFEASVSRCIAARVHAAFTNFLKEIARSPLLVTASNG